MDHVRKLKGQKIIMTVWGLNVTACALLCDQKSYRRAFFRPPLLLIKHNVPSAAAHRWKWMWWKKNTLPLVPFQWRKSAAVPCRAPSLCFKKCRTTHHKRVVTLCAWSRPSILSSSAIHSLFEGTNMVSLPQSRSSSYLDSVLYVKLGKTSKIFLKFH